MSNTEKYWTVYEVPKGPNQQSIIFQYWTLKRLLTYLNYTSSLIYNYKMLFNIITFHFYIPGVYFSVFMIILVEISVKGFLWKCAKKTSIYGQNHTVANSERKWTLLTNEKLSGVI